ncbi:uncharacterized [Tachysurus ichikawai]
MASSKILFFCGWDCWIDFESELSRSFSHGPRLSPFEQRSSKPLILMDFQAGRLHIECSKRRGKCDFWKHLLARVSWSQTSCSSSTCRSG